MSRVVGAKEPVSRIDWPAFKGLDIQPDVLSRPFDSWRRIENCDLFIPGSVRKIVGPEKYSGPLTSPILEMISYLRSSTDQLKRLGVGVNGHLYDLDSLADLGILGNVDQPFLANVPGTAGGVGVLYLVASVVGGPPVKYETVGGVTVVGCAPPQGGVTFGLFQYASKATNAYLMQVGIQYCFTYFNPYTLHESSPSPVTNLSMITPTLNTPPPATPWLTEVELNIPTPAPTLGTGYQNIRVYRTRDGGQTFFLLPVLYDSFGNQVVDSNGSVLITGPNMLLFDGFNNPPGQVFPPTPDQLLVNPPGGAPQPFANNPPPNAIWGAVYQGRLWLLDPNGVRLWFSNIGDFQSFGIFNYFDFSQDVFDKITAIVPLSDRLIVQGKNSARQITGTDFSDFVEVPIDMRRGAVGRRASISDGDNVYSLTAQSLALMTFARSGPPFLGDRIKPLTDTIQKSSFDSVICMEIDTNHGILFFAVKVNGVTYNDQIILIDLSQDSPFTLMVGLPTEVITVRELENADGSKVTVFSGADGNIYRVYATNTLGSLVATLETQQLPIDVIELVNVFRNLTLFGTDLSNWQVSWSIDGAPFTPPVGLQKVHPCGLSGQELVVRLTHGVANGVGALLSRGILKYTPKVSVH